MLGGPPHPSLRDLWTAEDEEDVRAFLDACGRDDLLGALLAVEGRSHAATSLVQASAMVAIQYWLTPQLWIKGGIGGANLGYSYDNGSTQNSDSESIADGGAAMGAVGYELLSAPRFSIDAQLRMIVGSYDQGQDVSGGSIGVGFNWF